MVGRYFFTGYLFGRHLLLVEQLDLKQSIVLVVVVFVTVFEYGDLTSLVVTCVVHLYCHQPCLHDMSMVSVTDMLI